MMNPFRLESDAAVKQDYVILIMVMVVTARNTDNRSGSVQLLDREGI